MSQTAEEAAQDYRDMATRLSRLHSGAAKFISRKDNNQVFEVAFWLRDVAQRIASGYASTDYRGLLRGYGGPDCDERIASLHDRVAALEKALEQLAEMPCDTAVLFSSENGPTPTCVEVWPDPRDEARSLCGTCTARELRAALTSAKVPEARARDEWHEEIGAVLWWRFPVVEPPYAGTPLDCDFPEYATHWTPIHVPTAPAVGGEASHG